MNCIGKLAIISVALLVRTSFAQSTNALLLYSTNLDLAQPLWQKLDASNSFVTVLAFGDSMADSSKSIQLESFNRMQPAFGASGASIDSWWLMSAGVSFIYAADSNWWAPHAILPPNEFIHWDRWTEPCDRLGLYWVAGPGGGLINVSVSTNHEAWSGTLFTVDGYSPTPVGRYTNFSLVRNTYRLRVDGVSGTNVIIGPENLDTKLPGVHVAYMARGSAYLGEIFQVSTNILYPILSALNPDLVIYHMKEVVDPGGVTLFSNQLITLETIWKACVPNAAIMYIGTPYDYRDQTWERAGLENLTLRHAAVRDHRIYMDCMTPCVSYQTMTNLGYFDTAFDVHPNAKCNKLLADLIWKQLGWFGLRLDRKLTAQREQGGAVLKWNSATNLTYRLEQSSNLFSWTGVSTQSGTGLVCAWTNTLNTSPAYFRLNITQP